jgi:hypothetical protein
MHYIENELTSDNLYINVIESFYGYVKKNIGEV